VDETPPLELSVGSVGQRRLCQDGRPELAEHAGCGWFILGPRKTWAEWQKLARQILATPDPDAS
jgi:hypothetical protein